MQYWCKLFAFRSINFANLICFWTQIPFVAMYLKEFRWLIIYLHFIGVFSLIGAIVNATLTSKSLRFHITAAAVGNLIFAMISVVHAAVAAAKLATFDAQEEHLPSNDDFSLDVIVALGFFNCKKERKAK